MNEFKTAYRSLDALLIDDIQFFAARSARRGAFHTFNELLEGQRPGDVWPATTTRKWGCRRTSK